jgi:hypothetical protein
VEAGCLRGSGRRSIGRLDLRSEADAGEFVRILFWKGVQEMFRLFRFLDRNRPSRKPRPKPPPKVRRFRPCLEELENRLVPAVNTYTVNTLTDTNPNGGGAGAGLTGDFRYCLNQAEAPGNAGSTIQFAPTLSGVIDLAAVLPALSQNVTIIGPGSGANQLTVERDPTAAAFRIFMVQLGVTAEIDNLTIENGIANGVANSGGGIYNAAGNLTLNNDDLYFNEATGKAAAGGAIANVAGTLNMIDCDIASNSATSLGGGIYNAGTLTDQSSQIYANNAQFGAGYYGGTGGSATLDYTQIYSNQSSSSGGGVYLAGNSNFYLCSGSIRSNTAALSGGGVYSSSTGTVQIQSSPVMGNTATGGSGGGIAVTGGNFTMDGGSIAGNTAGQNGGGLANMGGTVTLDQSLTVSSNTATNGNGGGLYLNSTSTTNLNGVTIMGNKAPKGAGNGGYLQNGGVLKPPTNYTDMDDPGGTLFPGP